MENRLLLKRYENIYEELMTKQPWKERAEYKTAYAELVKAEQDMLSKLPEGVNSKLWEMYERCTNAQAKETEFIFYELYLAGVRDGQTVFRTADF